ncbi:MAG: PEP-CTERM sorting domain-containing protein [Planctomycetota bacterium]
MIHTLLFKHLPCLIAAAAVVTFGSASASVVIFSDDFSDGLNPGYALVPSPPGTVTVETSGTGLDGNALKFSTTANNRGAARAFTPSVTLTNDGDFVELELDYRLTSAVSGFGFDVSLTGSAGAEGGVSFRSTPQNNGGTYFADSDNNAGRFDSIDSGTTRHNLVVRITKTSATEVVLTSSFDGVARDDSNTEVIGVDFANGLTFDGILVGYSSSNSGDFFIDNVSVTTNVPEPAALSLAALGLALIGCRRRGE